MDSFLAPAREALRLLLSGDRDLLRILALSLRVSGLAVVLGVALGLPLGVVLGLGKFPGRNLLTALVHTGFALPPVVVGLVVYMLLSRSGPAGALGLLFTPWAMVIAETLLAAPYVAGIGMAAVSAVPPDARLQARALGATRFQALLTHLREARLGLSAAVIASFGTVFHEVGAVMMVGGNIEGETRVLTTAIVLETRRGNFALALAMGFVLLLVAFAVNVLLMQLLRDRPPYLAAAERPVP